MILWTVVEVEADTQCEHVFALDHRFVVQTGIRQSRLGHLRNVRNDYVEIFQVQAPGSGRALRNPLSEGALR